MTENLGLKATLNECLCDTAFNVVKILNNTCLNGPLPAELFGKRRQLRGAFEPLALICPNRLDPRDFWGTQFVWVTFQVGDPCFWFPDGVSELIVH